MIGVRKSTTLALLALVSSPIQAEKPPMIDQLISSSADDRLAYQLVESLTTQVGPRPAGTEADTRARAWAVKQFRDLGFSNVRDEPFKLTAWIRGTESAHIVSPFPQQLTMTGLGRSIGTSKSGLEAEVVRFENFEALNASAADSLIGKIAFIDGRRMKRSKLGEDAGEGYGRRVKGATEAARKGAVGVLVRSVGSSEDRFAHSGGLRYEDGVKKIPGAALAHSDADQLARIIAFGKPVRVRLAMDAKLIPDSISGNIIAEIPGTDLAKEIVLLGAHLDSWDQGTGAIDDGTGVALVIAAAKQIMKMPQRPRRTIRIVLFGSEELGLEGAASYAKSHSHEKHIIATEADFGGARVWGFYTGVPQEMIPEMDLVAQQLSKLGIERGHNRASGGEDLGPLKQASKVPVASLVQDGTHYFDIHHTANDTLDKVDADALRQNVQAFAIFAWMMANPQIQ